MSRDGRTALNSYETTPGICKVMEENSWLTFPILSIKCGHVLRAYKHIKDIPGPLVSSGHSYLKRVALFYDLGYAVLTFHCQ